MCLERTLGTSQHGKHLSEFAARTRLRVTPVGGLPSTPQYSAVQRPIFTAIMCLVYRLSASTT
jgi:hypothetical protein